jgi:hypothetical protein
VETPNTKKASVTDPISQILKFLFISNFPLFLKLEKKKTKQKRFFITLFLLLHLCVRESNNNSNRIIKKDPWKIFLNLRKQKQKEEL